ncbi:MAG: hypothetical protein ABL951_02695 [Alphaproteobacteria bacterium]
MSKCENDRLVTRALWALRAYVDAVKSPPISPPVMQKKQDADHVSDLLTDLMHYCNGGEYSFDDCLRTAQINFNAEKKA